MKINNLNFLQPNNYVKKPEAEELTLDKASSSDEKKNSASQKPLSPAINQQSMFSRLMKLRLEVMAMKEMMSASKEGSITANGDAASEKTSASVSSDIPDSITGTEITMEDNMEGMLAMLDELMGMGSLPGMSQSSNEETKI